MSHTYNAHTFVASEAKIIQKKTERGPAGAFEMLTDVTTIQNDLYLLSDDYVSSVSVFASSGSVSASTFGPVCSVSASTIEETDTSGVVSSFTGSFGKQVDGGVREGDGLRDGSGAAWDVGSVCN